MNASPRLVLPGLALIAVSYGLARFAYGLFLPELRLDVGLDAAMAGAIGGGAYIGYCAAILVSAFLVERFGPRFTSAAAGGVAALGLLLAAISTSPAMLAAAVLIAGTSTGLASPPMAEAVDRVIPVDSQPRANTLINSGTGIGVALSGPIALAAAGHWRAAYLLFAALSVAVTIWLVLTMPGRLERPSPTSAVGPESNARPSLVRHAAGPVIVAAAGMGFASAAYWTFAGEVIVQVGRLGHEVSGYAWVTLGVAGLSGGAAGDLVRRFGINAVHRGSLVALAVSSSVLVMTPSSLVAVLVSAAFFGATYITLTGVYLVWGVRVYSDRPAIGLTLPFLMIAVGQAIGAPVAGIVIESVEYAATFTVFAGVAIFTTLVTWRPSRSETTGGPRSPRLAPDNC